MEGYLAENKNLVPMLSSSFPSNGVGAPKKPTIGQTSGDDTPLVLKDMGKGETGPIKDTINEVADTTIATMEPYSVPQL